MIRFVMPIILIGVSVFIFFMFTNPIYDSTDPLSPSITTLRAQMASYNEALNNSKALENERDKLTAKYNSIDLDNLARINKLLPENIDNIRLILEIEQIALPYGMVLKDIKYDATSDTNTTKNANQLTAENIQGGGVIKPQSKDYGVWDLEFSTVGTYNNFLNFTKDLESNLRIVDISSIQFSSNTNSVFNSTPNSPSRDSYKYDFKIKTYWLKN